MRAVIPSLGYADFLAVTLPAWRAALPPGTLTVVTAPDDEPSRAVAEQAGVPAILTEAWTQGGAILNKARALDQAFGFVPGHRDEPPAGEVCLALDADVYPCGPFPAESTVIPETLYSCARYACPNARALRAHLRGRTKRCDLRLIGPRVRGRRDDPSLGHSRANARATALRCLGYFQLFRWRPGIGFGSSRTAGGYDLNFRDHFAARQAILGFYVLHLGGRDRANWRGRVLPAWR